MVDPRDVLDAITRAVVATDPRGHIVLWNQAAEELYGWSEHEVVGRSVLDVLAPPHQANDDARDLDSVASGESKTGDRLVLRRDGELIRVHTFTAPMTDADGNVVAIVGSSEDVGANRLAEQSARDLSEHFRSALEAGGLGTWRWDMSSGVTTWDERLEELFGLPPGGFDGKFETYVSLLHPDDRDEVLARVAAAVESGASYGVDHRVVRPDGSVRWVTGIGGVTRDENGEITGTVGCCMDISARVEHESELRRMAELAEHASESERLHRERLEFLTTINEALSNSTSVAQVMKNVTRRAVPRLGDWCTIHVLPAEGWGTPDVEIAHTDAAMEQRTRELQMRFPYDPDAPMGVPAVIRTGRAEFYPEISDDVLAARGDLTDEMLDLVHELQLASAITVPLQKRGRVIGALQFVASASARRYTPDDVALATTVAARIASSIENLRLHEQQREIARTLERSLLPASLPELPGIDLAVRYWPNGEANEVGGDFFDLFALEHDGSYAVVLGDVCGTGIEAAALTGLARHTIRASAWHDDDHEEVLRSLNRAVRRSGQKTFLTCVYGTITITPGAVALTVTSAGHPLPTRVSREGPSLIGKPGTLLGIFDDPTVNTTSLDLDPGDIIVFHTDGATDVPPPHYLDDAAWTDLVHEAARRGGSADDIAEHIRASLEAILPFESRDDDIALMVLIVGAPRP